jgi:predicted metal-dependent enzyme (double-stranded beta helix superfamily)
MARSTRSRYLALVACLTLFLAGVPEVGTSLAQSVEPTNPWVGIAPDGDAMWGGSGWTPGNSVAISIDDPDPGDGDYATNVTVGPDEWSLQLEGVFDIQPGHLVTATDAAAGITKTHEVRGFTVDSVDTDADTVAGTAPAGTALTVKTLSPESCDTTATAESDGNWQANFVGLLSEGGQPCDISPGWSGSAEWYDDTDNDHTFMGWGVEDAPTPTFSVETPWDVWSSSEAWVEDDTVTIDIDDPSNGVGVDYTDTTTVERWGPEPWEVGFNLHTEPFEIHLGFDVTITATDIIKTLDVAALTITAVNETTDTVSGTGPTDAWVDVNAGNNTGDAQRTVQADGSGAWTANFSTPGTEGHEQNTLDITPGTGGSAQVFDNDGDSTHRGWDLQTPSLAVHLPDNQIAVGGFEPNAPVDVAVDDDGDSGNGVLWSQSGWTDGDGNAGFHPEGLQIEPDMTVTAEGSELFKSMIVMSVRVTDVDYDNDRIFGAADPLSEVRAEIRWDGSEGDNHRIVHADEFGNWIADYTLPGDEQSPDPVDLEPWMEISAEQTDEDNDQTVFNWRVANPTFSVETPFDVWSSSQDWVEDDTVTMTIDDPGTVDIDYSDQTTVERWGPEPWDVGFNFHTEPFEIRPGFEVTITATDTVRLLNVVGITVDTVDETTNTVSGTAATDAWVDVNAGNNTGDAHRTVQADGSGAWIANFSTPGTEGHEQNTLNFTPDTGGSAQVFDDDGDSTHRGWCFECDGGDIQPIPPIEMQPGEILISQTDGVLWVYDPETGSLEDHPLPFGGIWDIQWLGSDQVLIANSGDARIWILDLPSGEFQLLADGDPFQFPIGLALDPAAENLWVADGHAGIIRFNNGGAEVVVEPFGSPDGIVVADDGTVYFTAEGGTLYRVDETLPGNYAEVATAEGYGLNGLVMRSDGRVLATSMGPSALITFDPSVGTVSIEDYRTEMRTSEDSAFAANGDIYVADSGMVDEFGDDPGLYVRRATGGLEQLLRGEPLGDTVDLLVYEPSQRLQVYSTSTIPGYTDVVYAEHVSSDSTLTIEREDDPSSPYLFDTTEFDGRTATWTLSGVFDILAGDVVTAGDGDRTITHTVTPLAITDIDHETYTISGVARPDHVLAFNMVPLDPDGGYGPLLTRQISTDPVSGAWSVTLTDPPGPDEEGTVQFGPDGFPGSHGNIYDSDPDGSAETTLDWFVAPDLTALRNPQGIGDTGDMLMGRGWSLSETIEVDVADVDGSAALSTQVSAEWDCGSSCLQQGTWDLDDLGFTLDPGMTVTGYQEWPSHLDPPSSWTTTLEVQRLTVDLVDVVNDVVAGTADPFATVTIVQPPGSEATDEDHVVSVVVADLNGLWSADFNGLWDVDLGDVGTAGVSDAEGMDTRVLWQAPDPLIAIGLDPDGISGHGWLWHREIALTIDDLGTPEMPDLTVPATSDAGGSVEFDLGGFELQPGMEVTLTDNILTRTATIADYAYSPDPQSDPGVLVDPETDTVSGTAPAGSEVCVHIDGAAAPICISVLGASGTFVPWSISIPGGITYETVCVVKIIFNFTVQTTTVPADPPPTIDDVSISTDPGTGNSGFSFDAVDYGDYSCADPYLLSVEIDWGDETSPLTERVAPNSTIHASHVYGKTGTYEITVTVTEPCELQEFTSTLTVDIPNTAPEITALTGPVEPVAIGTAISVDGEFDDPNWLDEHSLTVEWGDGTSDTVTSAASPFTIGHTYTEPGVYRVDATVADDEGGTGTAEYAYIVVYDPLGGFATGAGTVGSPAGAYVPDPVLTGTASFGFVSKYKKGATTPSGTTEFEFAAGDVFFWSRTFDWLVIAGPKAQFKGAGTINGLGDFGFMVTAVDAKLTESTDVDLFRIKIWDRVTGDIVYDNLLDADDDADPTTEINSGNIVIHKAKPDKRK